MTDKTMTLEQVRACIDVFKAADLNVARQAVLGLAEAYARHLSQPAERGEAVAVPRKLHGMACTVAWTELYNAMAKDGMVPPTKCGPATRAWIEEVVRNEFAANTAPPPAAGVPDKWHRTETESEQMTEYEKGVADGWDEFRAAMLSEMGRK